VLSVGRVDCEPATGLEADDHKLAAVRGAKILDALFGRLQGLRGGTPEKSAVLSINPKNVKRSNQ